MTENRDTEPDLSKLNDENVKNFRKQEPVDENKKWVKNDEKSENFMQN
jgi:hypothetical protein